MEKPIGEAGESPDEMKAEGPGDKEDPSQALQELGDYMSKVAGSVVPGLPKASQKQFADIMGAYTQFVDGLMGGGSQPADAGQMPMDQGAGGVPMGPQSRQ
jgi:hypothetical protein